jgi:hypothetical protein
MTIEHQSVVYPETVNIHMEQSICLQRMFSNQYYLHNLILVFGLMKMRGKKLVLVLVMSMDYHMQKALRTVHQYRSSRSLVLMGKCSGAVNALMV